MTQANHDNWDEAKKLVGFIMNGEQKHINKLVIFLRNLIEEIQQESKNKENS